MKICLKKLEKSLCRMMRNLYRYLKPRRRGSRVWQTDRRTVRQTDRTTFSNSAL